MENMEERRRQRAEKEVKAMGAGMKTQ